MGRHAHRREDVERRLYAAYDAVDTGVSTPADPSWWAKHGCKDLPFGTIIDVSFHTPDSETEVDTLEINRAATVCGVVHTKTRLVVVAKDHSMHPVCVPVYSQRGGRGSRGRAQRQGRSSSRCRI